GGTTKDMAKALEKHIQATRTKRKRWIRHPEDTTGWIIYRMDTTKKARYLIDCVEKS
ncbi:hypothetical protein GWI33_023175, partial [Rhynchophorus ferrugineus]